MAAVAGSYCVVALRHGTMYNTVFTATCGDAAASAVNHVVHLFAVYDSQRTGYALLLLVT